MWCVCVCVCVFMLIVRGSEEGVLTNAGNTSLQWVFAVFGSFVRLYGFLNPLPILDTAYTLNP